MKVGNDETTGRTGVCRYCGKKLEQGLLMRGVMVRVSLDPSVPKRPSPGVPTWRTLDRGAGSAVCRRAKAKRHDPRPSSVRMDRGVEQGAAFGLVDGQPR